MNKVIKYILHIPSGLTYPVSMNINDTDMNSAIRNAKYQDSTGFKYPNFNDFIFKCIDISGAKFIITENNDFMATVNPEELELITTKETE